MQMLKELRSLELHTVVSKALCISESGSSSLPADINGCGVSNTAEPDVTCTNVTSMLADQWSAMLLLLPAATWDAAPDQVGQHHGHMRCQAAGIE